MTDHPAEPLTKERAPEEQGAADAMPDAMRGAGPAAAPATAGGPAPVEPAARAGRWYRRIRLAAAAVVLIGLVVSTAATAWQLRDDRRSAADHTAVQSLAGQEASDLVTIDSTTVSQRLDQLIAHSTDSFRKDLTSLRETFAQIVQQGGVSSQGSVSATAISSITRADARVLVALSTSVTNKSAAAPASKDYRVAVTLRKSGQRWLVSGMEFVS